MCITLSVVADSLFATTARPLRVARHARPRWRQSRTTVPFVCVCVRETCLSNEIGGSRLFVVLVCFGAVSHNGERNETGLFFNGDFGVFQKKVENMTPGRTVV